MALKKTRRAETPAARKGWLTRDQVLNTRSLEGFLRFVAQKKTR